MALITMKELLEAGVHFGHRRRRWNPRMRQYIFTERNGIHIIDLQQTIRRIEEAHNLVRDITAEGGTILFVGTKRQAAENLAAQAQRCGMPYVNQRWLGGLLTNFRTIRQRADHLLDLEREKEEGQWSALPKKEASWKEKELIKLQREFGGIKHMYYLPAGIFVVDVEQEAIAIKEANTLEIPVIAMVDTNCNPHGVDYLIPANDDAIRAINLITGKIADAVIEGQMLRGVNMAEQEAERDRAGVGPVASATVEVAAAPQTDAGGETEHEVSELVSDAVEEIETEAEATEHAGEA